LNYLVRENRVIFNLNINN